MATKNVGDDRIPVSEVLADPAGTFSSILPSLIFLVYAAGRLAVGITDAWQGRILTEARGWGGDGRIKGAIIELYDPSFLDRVFIGAENVLGGIMIIALAFELARVTRRRASSARAFVHGSRKRFLVVTSTVGLSIIGCMLLSAAQQFYFERQGISLESAAIGDISLSLALGTYYAAYFLVARGAKVEDELEDVI